MNNAIAIIYTSLLFRTFNMIAIYNAGNTQPKPLLDHHAPIYRVCSSGLAAFQALLALWRAALQGLVGKRRRAWAAAAAMVSFLMPALQMFASFQVK